MELNSSSGESSDSDSGETNYANRSKWHANGGGSNDSTAPEDTGSSVRDNGEGPSRRPVATGGSPDDPGSSDDGGGGYDDDDGDDGDDESDDSGYGSGPRRKKSRNRHDSESSDGKCSTENSSSQVAKTWLLR